MGLISWLELLVLLPQHDSATLPSQLGLGCFPPSLGSNYMDSPRRLVWGGPQGSTLEPRDRALRTPTFILRPSSPISSKRRCFRDYFSCWDALLLCAYFFSEVPKVEFTRLEIRILGIALQQWWILGRCCKICSNGLFFRSSAVRQLFRSLYREAQPCTDTTCPRRVEALAFSRVCAFFPLGMLLAPKFQRFCGEGTS